MKMLTHRPESIAENFITQPQNFINLIHSNCIKNFRNITDLAELTNIFSINDLFTTEYRDSNIHNLNLDMVIRASMVFNKEPLPGFRPIGGLVGKKFKEKEQQEIDRYQRNLKILNNGNLLSRDNYFCDYNGFLKLIDVPDRDRPVIT